MRRFSTKDSPEAIILCGGKGERLRPVTNEIPKPLVKINDKPILYYVIEHLLKYNINNINVASGYKSTILKNYLDTHPFKANIKIYDSGDVDIIKRIQGIMKEVKKDVLILYGDTISDVNIFELIQCHRKSSKKMTMTVWPLKIPYGLVNLLDDGTIESFTEKPTLDKWINIGYFYLNKSCAENIFQHEKFEDFLLHSANDKSIIAYKHHRLHITINTLAELDEAQKNIKHILIDKK